MNIIDYPPLQLDTNLSKEAAFRLLSRREKCYIYIFCVHIICIGRIFVFTLIKNDAMHYYLEVLNKLLFVYSL